MLWKRPLDVYKGLPMFCAPGVHEEAFRLLSPHLRTEISVLDLASGSGAWIQRLRDHGCACITAVELNTWRFQLKDTEPLSIDLNTDFSGALGGPFTVITAMEIIEHLDSPRHFLQQVSALLAPGGYLLLSTPNIANMQGRWRFFKTGEHRMFDEFEYHQQRHINPVTDTHLRLMLRENNFEVLQHVTAGSFYGPLGRMVMTPLNGLFSLIFGRQTRGEINIYLARRSVS